MSKYYKNSYKKRNKPFGTVYVIGRPYQGEEVIENVVNYVVTSPHACDQDCWIYNNVQPATVVNDMYMVQQNRNMENHRRLYQFIITSKDYTPSTIHQAGIVLGKYFEERGFQCIGAFHNEGTYSEDNYHCHFVVNAISYVNYERLLDKRELYSDMEKYLNEYMKSKWYVNYKTMAPFDPAL